MLPYMRRHQMERALLALCAGNSPVTGEFPHKGQWRGALMFSLIHAWINDSVNNREAGDLTRYRAHYEVNVMTTLSTLYIIQLICDNLDCAAMIDRYEVTFDMQTICSVGNNGAVWMAFVALWTENIARSVRCNFHSLSLITTETEQKLSISWFYQHIGRHSYRHNKEVSKRTQYSKCLSNTWRYFAVIYSRNVCPECILVSNYVTVSSNQISFIWLQHLMSEKIIFAPNKRILCRCQPKSTWHTKYTIPM